MNTFNKCIESHESPASFSAAYERILREEERNNRIVDSSRTVAAQDSQNGVRAFKTGAVRSNDVDRLRYDLIPHVALRRLAARYGMGAEKYGDHNYLKGIPYSNIINHMQAHLEKFKADRCTKDDNLAAIAWGAAALMAFEAMGRSDLDDLVVFEPAFEPTEGGE